MNQIITLNLDGVYAVPKSSLILHNTIFAYIPVREVLFIPNIVTGGHYSEHTVSAVFRLPAGENNMLAEDLF